MSPATQDALVRALGALSPLPLPEPILAEIVAAYGDGARAYHGLEHVLAVAREFAALHALDAWERPREVFLALLYHDAVYVPGAGDNEIKSAALARSALAAWLADAGLDAERIAALILATARHGALTAAEVDPEAALFLDCDMAVLGAPAGAYDAYERGIAAEYAGVPQEAFRAGRRAFLAGLLAKPRIFLSDRFHARLDAAARENLSRALAVIG